MSENSIYRVRITNHEIIAITLHIKAKLSVRKGIARPPGGVEIFTKGKSERAPFFF